MAIYIPSVDYGATLRATELEHRSEIYKTQTERHKLDQRGLDIQQERITDHRTQTAINSLLELAKIGIDAYGLIEQGQLAEAKNKGGDDLDEFSEIVRDSVLNDRTFATQDENGQWKIQYDPALGAWYDSKMSEISTSKNSKAVKLWQQDNLKSIWRSGQQQIFANVLSKTQKTIDQQHSLSIQKATEIDTGLSTFDQRSYDTGFSVIESRADLSPFQKDVQHQLYQQSVDMSVDQRQVEAVAATKGLASATAMIHGWSKYTPDEKASLITQAQRTDSALTATLVEQVASVMQTGLESGAPPAAIYEKIKQETVDMPTERVSKATDEARKVHVAWATQEAHKLYAQDAESTDAQFLSDRATSMRTGALHDSLFYGIEHTGETFAGMYDKLASDIKKQIENVTKEEVAQNKHMIDTVFNMYQSGDISRDAALEMIYGISESTPGSFADDSYQSEIIRKIQDTLVPDKYKPMVNDFLKGLESINFGIKVTKKDPKHVELVGARQFAEKALADLFTNKNVADMSPSEIQESLNKIYATFTDKTIKALASGEVVDKFRIWNDPAAIDDALAKNHKFMEQDSTIVVKSSGPSGGYVWSNAEYEETFNAISSSFRDELSKHGIDITSPPTPLTINGETYPTPLLVSGDGTYYTVNQNDVFSSPNGKDSWNHEGSISTTKKFKNEGALDEYFDQFRDDVQPGKRGTPASIAALNLTETQAETVSKDLDIIKAMTPSDRNKLRTVVEKLIKENKTSAYKANTTLKNYHITQKQIDAMFVVLLEGMKWQ